MTIFLGADHGGFALKEKIKEWLNEWGHEFIDKGNTAHDPDDDFPDFAAAVAEEVAKDPKNRIGIVLCRSGAGVDMTANKFPGVRASVLFNTKQAYLAKKDDAVNVLALASDYTGEEKAKEIVKIWIETPFEEGVKRRTRRLKKIEEIEKANFQASNPKSQISHNSQ